MLRIIFTPDSEKNIVGEVQRVLYITFTFKKITQKKFTQEVITVENFAAERIQSWLKIVTDWVPENFES